MKPQDDNTKSRHASHIKMAGAGTFFYFLVEQLPLENQWKCLLRPLAPTVAVAAPPCWHWLQSILRDYLNEMKNKKLLNRAKKIMTESINNPLTSSEHHHKIIREYEDLELARLHACVHKLKDSFAERPGQRLVK